MNGAPAAVLILLTIFGSIFGITWMVMHYRTRSAVQPKELAAIEAQLRQISQAVDAIAVETERISEGQRFTTKLLNERAGAPAAEVRR